MLREVPLGPASITAAGSVIQPDRVTIRVLGTPYAAVAGGKASTE
jgi:hypothetical protein